MRSLLRKSFLFTGWLLGDKATEGFARVAISNSEVIKESFVKDFCGPRRGK